MRPIICAMLIVLSLSACAFSDDSAKEIRLTVFPLEETEELFGVNVETTEELPKTYTPTPTLRPITSVPQPTSTPSPATIRSTGNCSVRTDLPIYIVATGDTLSNIATRYNTTTNQLSQFNCLTDANLISVGMSLRVPIAPTPTASSTPIPSPTPIASPTIAELGIRGTLSASPVIEAGNPSNWNDYVIAPQTPITIMWTGIEPEYYADIITVTFFFTPDVGATIQLGVDDNMSDGMSVTWTPPAGVSGNIIGSARTSYNAFWRSSTLHVRDS